MLYTVTLDKENYLTSVAHTQNDNIELDLSTLNLPYLNAYKMVDNAPVLDEEKLQALIEAEQQEAKNEEIEELKDKLSKTDYVMAETFEEIMSLESSVTFVIDFINIIKQFKNQYAEVISERKAWRQRIKELSK